MTCTTNLSDSLMTGVSIALFLGLAGCGDPIRGTWVDEKPVAAGVAAACPATTFEMKGNLTASGTVGEFCAYEGFYRCTSYPLTIEGDKTGDLEYELDYLGAESQSPCPPESGGLNVIETWKCRLERDGEQLECQAYRHGQTTSPRSVSFVRGD